MSYFAVDEDGSEWKFREVPQRQYLSWMCFKDSGNIDFLEQGTIEKIIGKKLTWADEPVELKDK